MFQRIDSHCHIYPEAIAKKAAEQTAKFYGGLPATCDGTVDALIELGARAGIDHFVVQSVATKPAQVRSINQFIAQKVRENPEKLTGLGTLHPESEDIEGDVAHLLELGLKGVKLHPDIQQFQLDCEKSMKIMECCAGRLPILVHTGDDRFDYSNPNRLVPVLDRFPQLIVVGAHFGGYSIWEEALEALAEKKNLYVDCSSSMFAMDNEMVLKLIRGYGAERVLFGTDYPMWLPEEEMKRFLTLDLTEEERELILHKNAEKIYGIDVGF